MSPVEFCREAMESIYIPQLIQFPDHSYSFPFKEYFPRLHTLTPVKGELCIQHKGTYLEVSTQAEAIVTLNCCRCLNNYNHRLDVEATELIWLEKASQINESPLLEQEVAVEDLVETLSPTDHFQPKDWLYQQLCLAIPQRQLCDGACPGIEVAAEQAAERGDRRWAALANLKQQMSSSD